MFSYRFLTSALALAAFALPASASLSTYSTIAAFNGANADQVFQNVTFDAFVGNTYTTFTDALTTIAFSDGNANGMLIAANPGGFWPTGTVLKTSTGGQTITVSVPNTAQSFAMNIGQLNANVGFTISITNVGGDTYSHTFSQGNIDTPLFFGFRTDSQITSFSIHAEHSLVYLALNGVEVGTPGDVTETPEVATLLMIGSGLISVRLFRRRQMRMA